MSTTPEFQIKDGDRVLFYGDSITEQRFYTTYVETFVRTRHPGISAEFIVAGVGGDTVAGGWLGDVDTRVKRDIAPQRPTVVTIMLGMNDGGYLPPSEQGFATFRRGYDRLVEMIREAAPGARITLIGASPFDDIGHPDAPQRGYNLVVAKFADYARQVAEREGLEFVDFNEPVCRFVAKAVAADPIRAQAIIPDAIHPDPPGHLAMAGELLKAWGATPIVSNVELDASAKRVVSAEKATVSDWDGVSWTQHDELLPYPTDELTALAVEFSGFMDELNRQTLRVTGLERGIYALCIDECEVGRFTSEQLATGANLAALETPMLLQSRKVLDFATKRNEAFWLKWQKLELGFPGVDAAQPVIEALSTLEREMHRRELASCETVPHRFELRRTG